MLCVSFKHILSLLGSAAKVSFAVVVVLVILILAAKFRVGV